MRKGRYKKLMIQQEERIYAGGSLATYARGVISGIMLVASLDNEITAIDYKELCYLERLLKDSFFE